MEYSIKSWWGWTGTINVRGLQCGHLYDHVEHSVKIVSVAAAKAHLSELLARIERGEEIIITRRGKRVARLSPIQQAKKPISSLQEFRDQLPRQKIPASDVLRLLREESR